MSATQTNHLARVRGFLETADVWRLEDYDRYLSPSVSMVFGNGEPMVGLEQVKTRAARTRASLTAMGHELLSAAADEATRRLAVELVVHYRRPDGRELSYPAAIFVHFDTDDLIDDYRIFADISTLWD